VSTKRPFRTVNFATHEFRDACIERAAELGMSLNAWVRLACWNQLQRKNPGKLPAELDRPSGNPNLVGKESGRE
jgi:hypothetical protein